MDYFAKCEVEIHYFYFSVILYGLNSSSEVSTTFHFYDYQAHFLQTFKEISFIKLYQMF